MINSLLMLGSTYRNRKANVIFMIIWIGYMLFNTNLKTGLVFSIINIVTFLVVVGASKIVKSKNGNKAISVLAILIWSVLIDIICFYLYPQFNMGQNLFSYIMNGIIFNYKYVFINILAISAIKSFNYVSNKIKTINFIKKEIVNILQYN